VSVVGLEARSERRWKWTGMDTAMQNNSPVVVVVIVMLLLTFGASCRERPKPMRQIDELDGAYVSRSECEKPGVDCAQRCYLRGASSTCYGCCGDQDFLCDTQQPYSYEYCDSTR
jgi:hypothetical protein